MRSLIVHTDMFVDHVMNCTAEHVGHENERKVEHRQTQN